jgi:hypothetical protein
MVGQFCRRIVRRRVGGRREFELRVVVEVLDLVLVGLVVVLVVVYLLELKWALWQ